MPLLLGLDVERGADVLRGQRARGHLDDAVEVGTRQIGAVVADGVNAHAALQELLHKLFAGDGIVRVIDVVLRRRVPAEGDTVFDGIFGEHGRLLRPGADGWIAAPCPGLAAS